jgi:hypothetical protein
MEKNMKTLHTFGGIGALICAATYLLAMGLAATLLTPMFDNALPYNQFIAFYLPHQSLVFVWHFSMYLVNGTFLALLTLALYQHLKTNAPALSLVSACFGLLWTGMVFASGFISLYGWDIIGKLAATSPSEAATLRLVVYNISTGIDTSDRFLGCLWVLLASCAALRTKQLAKPLNYWGLVIGTAGILSSCIPGLATLGIAFGLGVIVWWIWLGIVLLRVNRNPAIIPYAELRTTTP